MLSLGSIFSVKIVGWLFVSVVVGKLFLYAVLSSHFFCYASSRIADAEENLGESEVREAHLAKSLFYIQIGDKVVEDYSFASNSTILCNFFYVYAIFTSNFSLMDPGESFGTTKGNRKQNSCCWAKDGLGVPYATAWIFLHGFWSYFQKHW